MHTICWGAQKFQIYNTFNTRCNRLPLNVYKSGYMILSPKTEPYQIISAPFSQIIMCWNMCPISNSHALLLMMNSTGQNSYVSSNVANNTCILWSKTFLTKKNPCEPISLSDLSFKILWQYGMGKHKYDIFYICYKNIFRTVTNFIWNFHSAPYVQNLKSLNIFDIYIYSGEVFFYFNSLTMH